MSKELKQFDDATSEPKIEKKYFQNLIVLGNAVPDEISGHRITVCTVAYSHECGLIRIYPVPPTAPMKRWNVVSLYLERNPQDNRSESWKIHDSKAKWDTLSDQITVEGKLPRKKRIELIESLKKNHSYGCIEDINDKKLSLGIISPQIIDHRFEERTNKTTTVQSKLIDTDLFMTINNYPIRPVISYRCPECRVTKQMHNQGVLEWGIYEWLRQYPKNKEQVWENLQLDNPEYDTTFLVGNMNRYRSSFLIISILRYKI